MASQYNLKDGTSVTVSRGEILPPPQDKTVCVWCERHIPTLTTFERKGERWHSKCWSEALGER